MEIDIKSVVYSGGVMTVDGDEAMPVVVIQYDPPWDKTSVGEHRHYIPLMAIGDVQMTYGVQTDIEAIELIILRHLGEVLLNVENPEEFRKQQADTGKAIREALTSVGDYLLEEAKSAVRSGVQDVGKHLMDVSNEARGNGLAKARAAGAASRANAVRSNLHSKIMGKSAGHSMKRNSKGYKELEAVLSAHTDKIDTERRKIFNSRYGELVRHVAAMEKFHQERKARGLE